MKVTEHIPRLCPLQYHLEAGTVTSFFSESIPSPESPACYLQKFKSKDSIRVQFWGRITDDTGDDPTIVATLVDSYGTTIATATVFSAMTGISDPSLIFYRFKYNVTSFTNNIFYSVLSFTDEDGERIYVSEPFHIYNHDDTILLKYSNTLNAFDVNFGDSEANFQLRVEGGFYSEGYAPGSKDVVYFNQTHDPVILHSIPFMTKKITFGDGGGIPNWLADKINRIFACDTVLVDEVEMVKNDGAKMEPTRGSLFPMAGWSLELIEGTNNFSD